MWLRNGPGPTIQNSIKMRKLYFISYDKVGDRNYQPLYDALVAMGGKRALESLWFVRVTLDAQAVLTGLLPYIDRNDRLIVMESSSGVSLNPINDPMRSPA